jgi:hypothetical protein
MELLPPLEALRNGFTKPSFRYFTMLVFSACVLPIVTSGPLSLVRMQEES